MFESNYQRMIGEIRFFSVNNILLHLLIMIMTVYQQLGCEKF